MDKYWSKRWSKKVQKQVRDFEKTGKCPKACYMLGELFGIPKKTITKCEAGSANCEICIFDYYSHE